MLDPTNKTDLLDIVWNKENSSFMLENTRTGYKRESSITEAEDVSYVSTAYIPQCLRLPYSPEPHDYSHLAEAAAEAAGDVKDELQEVIHLTNVRVLMGEWIPFGPNKMSELNARLGSDERAQGGCFSPLLDDGLGATQCSLASGLTSLRVLDFFGIQHVNVEASIEFPEDDGIVQIENFGINVRETGSVIYGLRIDSVMDRVKHDVSIDLLSRLMVDIHVDSSALMHSVLSPYQKTVISHVYGGSEGTRDKFAVVLADEISPRMLADKYLDKEEHESELKQVIFFFFFIIIS